MGFGCLPLRAVFVTIARRSPRLPVVGVPRFCSVSAASWALAGWVNIFGFSAQADLGATVSSAGKTPPATTRALVTGAGAPFAS